MAIFEIKNLNLRYPSAKHDVLVVEELDIHEGEIVFVVGPSGIGKSTLLETLGLMTNTISEPNSSEANFKFLGNQSLLRIWLQGDVAASQIRREHFSFVFQNTNLLYNLTALENVMITSILQGESLEKAEAVAREVLGRLIPDLNINAHVSALSGGQRQRLAFARAIACRHEIFFADEPTGNLDQGNAKILMDLLTKQLRDTNKTAVIVSHSIEHAMSYATKIVWMDAQFWPDGTKYGLISAFRNYSKAKDADIWVNQTGDKISQHELEMNIRRYLEVMATTEA